LFDADKGKTRQSTVSRVYFPTLPSLSLQPVKTQLYQEEYQHDILVLQFRATYENWFNLLNTGVPVEFTWVQDSLKNTWIGYVSFVSKQVSGQLEQVMEVHCVGATFVLKERATEVFENSTIPAAVEKIVSKYGFKFVGKDNELVFEQLSMAGHSYWEWIQEQAKRIGYGVLIDGMTFIFKPLDDLIDYGVTSIPVMSMMGKGIASNIMYSDRTLDSFVVINGESVEDPTALRAVKSVNGVDPFTGKIVYATKSPAQVGINLREAVSDVLFSEMRSDQVAFSPTSADSLAKGAAHNARMNLPAKVRGQGDPRIKVFSPVLIRGTGDATDGYWLVKKVLHMFGQNGNYQVEMSIATDGSGFNARTSVRQDTGTAVGVLNLVDALSNSGVARNTAVNGAYGLRSMSVNIAEFNQGFSRSKTRWVYSPLPSKGVS
jgi:phage protein D